jgi:hypothetical protein
MAKNTQSNRNIIQIHNLVKVAEEKKKKQRRRRSPVMQPIMQPPLLATRIMQQLAPQVQPTPQQTFPGNAPDPDLVKSLRDAVSSQAAQMNEMRDARDRENEMYAAGINDILRGIDDRDPREFSRGQGRASNASSFPVEQEAQETFEDDNNNNSNIPRQRQPYFADMGTQADMPSQTYSQGTQADMPPQFFSQGTQAGGVEEGTQTDMPQQRQYKTTEAQRRAQKRYREKVKEESQFARNVRQQAREEKLKQKAAQFAKNIV